jgi:hypothetical protein
MRRVLVLLGLCGCDALFGLDTLSYTPDAPGDVGPDAPRITVTGRVSQRWLYTDASFAPFIEEVQPTAPLVHLSDGSVAATTWDPANGVLSFQTGPGEVYSVTHDTSIGSFEYQLTSPTFWIQDLVPGHPDQVAPGPNAGVQWVSPVMGLAATDLRVASTGVWTSTVPTSPVANTFTVSWPNAVGIGGQSHAVLSGAAHDSLYFLHLTTVAGTPSYRVVDQSAVVHNATLNANSSTSYTTTLQPLVRSNCVDIHSRRAAEYASLSKYAGFATPAGTTQLFALAKPELGFRAPYELAVYSGTTDVGVSVNYANPFTGFDLLVFENNVLTRTTTGNLTLSANTQYLDLISPTTSCTRHDDPAQPSFVVSPTLGGVPLADDVVIGIDTTKPVELAWSWDGAPAPITQVTLVKNGLNVRSWQTTESKVRIDPALLEPNTSYRITMVAITGYYPNAATGDLVTHGYPTSLGVVMYGYFKVVKSS